MSGVTINGTALDPAGSYRITTNNFLADGGDDFVSLKARIGRTTLSDFDIDSLVRYSAPTTPSAPYRAAGARPGRRHAVGETHLPGGGGLAQPPPGR